jgi:hypothetical protein
MSHAQHGTTGVVVLVLIAISGLVPIGIAVTMIRRRSVAFLVRDDLLRDKRPLEGRGVVVTGWGLLLLMGLAEASLAYAIAQEFLGPELLGQRTEVLVGQIALGVMFCVLAAGVVGGLVLLKRWGPWWRPRR